MLSPRFGDKAVHAHWLLRPNVTDIQGTNLNVLPRFLTICLYVFLNAATNQTTPVLHHNVLIVLPNQLNRRVRRAFAFASQEDESSKRRNQWLYININNIHGCQIASVAFVPHLSTFVRRRGNWAFASVNCVLIRLNDALSPTGTGVFRSSGKTTSLALVRLSL
jgi:hypothetical protein